MVVLELLKRLELLKKSDGPVVPVKLTDDALGSGGVFERIRCPKCEWTPTTSSRWSCDHRNTPEPPFESCGAVWHTFSTHGRCPGCLHQWHWTSCLACGQASQHVDWYQPENPRT